MSDQGRPTISLSNAVAKGAAWTVSFRMADRFIGLLSTLILARVLAPADFGLVAMATTLIALIDVVTVGEFSSAIIQNPDAVRDHYDTAWTLSALFGLTAAVLMLLLAQPTARYFNEPRLVNVIYALSVMPLADGLFNMGCVDFRKRLEFQKDFMLQVGRKISSFVVVVPLALITRSYWALVYGMVAGRMAGLMLSYYLHPFRPKFSLQSARSLFSFSGWMMANNGLNFLSQRSAHLVIGRLLTPQALGVYSIAHEMAHLPTTEFAMPVNRALFPGYAKLQDDRDALQAAFLRVLGVIVMAVVPAGIGLASVAHLFVPAVLGTKWMEAAPLIAILALAGTAHATQANLESVYFAIGRPRLKALIILVEVATFVPLLIWLVPQFGLSGAAWALLVTASVAAPVNFGIALRLLKLPIVRLISVLWRPMVASFAMAVVVHIGFGAMTPDESAAANVARLFAAAVTGALVYSVTMWWLWLGSGRPDGAERWILGIARSAACRALKRPT